MPTFAQFYGPRPPKVESMIPSWKDFDRIKAVTGSSYLSDGERSILQRIAGAVVTGTQVPIEDIRRAEQILTALERIHNKGDAPDVVAPGTNG